MTMYRFSNESPAYRKLRDELAQEEIALKDQCERVAALRRRLPQGVGLETDFTFREGPRDLAAGDGRVAEVRLSELFEQPDHPLVLMHFMYGRRQKEFCPMCTMWADGYDGVVPHLRQRVNFAVLVAGDVVRFRSYARSRGWRHLRLLGDGSALKRALGFEDQEGGQMPGVSVFTRGDDGAVRHFYSGGAFLGKEHFRGMDLLSPVWSFFDLTPEGRGDWMPKLSYKG
jgi:predicted dithiol-disulfide oxidoreductase (DUF899 family)